MADFNAAYQKRLCEVAHELLWWGYKAARSQIDADRHENDITGFVFDGMVAALDEPLLPAGYNRYEPHEEWRQSSRTRSGDSRQRIDIVIRYTEPRPRVRFCFEAKRLKSGSHPIGDYTGEEGMGCFINEEYAADDPDAAMVAYMQSHDVTRWSKELKRAFEPNNAHGLACSSPLVPVSVFPDIADELVSAHQRPTKGKLTIYHIFLDCT